MAEVKRPMSRIPEDLDLVQWILADSSEYFTFARHLTEQNVRWMTIGKRKPMHRSGTSYFKDRTKRE